MRTGWLERGQEGHKATGPPPPGPTALGRGEAEPGELSPCGHSRSQVPRPRAQQRHGKARL